MTKRDYHLIANIVRKHGGDRRRYLACAFAGSLSKDNPAFDPDKFFEACGETL